MRSALLNGTSSSIGRDLDNLLEIRSGASFPVQFPLVFREILGDPSLSCRHKRANPERAYREHLGERPVRLVTPRITTFLFEVG